MQNLLILSPRRLFEISIYLFVYLFIYLFLYITIQKGFPSLWIFYQVFAVLKFEPSDMIDYGFVSQNIKT